MLAALWVLLNVINMLIVPGTALVLKLFPCRIQYYVSIPILIAWESIVIPQVIDNNYHLLKAIYI